MRTILTCPTSFYVAASAVQGDGSKISPWNNLQYAHDYVQNNYDLAGNTVTFICQGVFSSGINELGSLVGQTSPNSQVYSFIDNSSVTSTGNTFSSTYGIGYILQSSDNLTITAPQGVAISTSSGSTIALNAGITIGICSSSQLQTAWGGNIYLNCDITFTGNAQQCLFASGGVIQLNPGMKSTWVGTVKYSNCYAWAYAGGVIGINGQTFTGSVYGIKYKSEFLGIIATGGRGINYLPGNQAGGIDLGGQYY